jgi:hypothetical protein
MVEAEDDKTCRGIQVTAKRERAKSPSGSFLVRGDGDAMTDWQIGKAAGHEEAGHERARKVGLLA